MTAGNSATADPNPQADPLPPAEGVTGNEGEQTQDVTPEQKLAVLSEKYKHSSGEARRLNEEKKALEERLNALERDFRERSLTPQRDSQATENRFPTEEEYVKTWVENGDKTEREARLEYKSNSVLWQNQQNLFKSIEAIAKRQQFESELREKSLYETSSEAKAATEMFKGIPYLEGLSAVQKMEVMKKLQPNLAPRAEGRDTSLVKQAASGSVGNGASAATSAQNSQLDEIAKANGFPNWKVQEELRKCQTAEQYQAVKKKYNLKN
jgi:hypothetical protein